MRRRGKTYRMAYLGSGPADSGFCLIAAGLIRGRPVSLKTVGHTCVLTCAWYKQPEQDSRIGLSPVLDGIKYRELASIGPQSRCTRGKNYMCFYKHFNKYKKFTLGGCPWLSWFHLNCVGLKPADKKNLKNVIGAKWYCDKCVVDFNDPIECKVAKLMKNVVEKFRQEIKELKDKIKTIDLDGTRYKLPHGCGEYTNIDNDALVAVDENQLLQLKVPAASPSTSIDVIEKRDVIWKSARHQSQADINATITFLTLKSSDKYEKLFNDKKTVKLKVSVKPLPPYFDLMHKVYGAKHCVNPTYTVDSFTGEQENEASIAVMENEQETPPSPSTSSTSALIGRRPSKIKPKINSDKIIETIERLHKQQEENNSHRFELVENLLFIIRPKSSEDEIIDLDNVIESDHDTQSEESASENEEEIIEEEKGYYLEKHNFTWTSETVELIHEDEDTADESQMDITVMENTPKALRNRMLNNDRIIGRCSSRTSSTNSKELASSHKATLSSTDETSKAIKNGMDTSTKHLEIRSMETKSKSVDLAIAEAIALKLEEIKCPRKKIWYIKKFLIFFVMQY
ncbi:hypothetical protein RN001_005585 [Aquatica leii]|uniref:Uncharacterized protein n=1 Tax=Aquatica leii TaxID=1421715 RepID=A0AAN7PH83_9COLE|nr:hypothetical protein RN001_005585 [Aquatica leii]